MFGKRKRQIKKFIEEMLTENHSEHPDLPEVGEYADDMYKVVICPVCGNKTLDLYYICSHCGWEHDETEEGRYSSTNRATLGEYRKIYKKVVRKIDRTREKKKNV